MLDPVETADNPPPGAAAVTPLIDGAETFTALATAIRNARHSVKLAYWALDPEHATPLSNGLSWGDLLAATAQRGVDVQLLVTDFDPVLGMTLHRAAVRCEREMMRRVHEGPDGVQQHLMVRRHMHPARVGAIWRPIDWLIRRMVLRRALRKRFGESVYRFWRQRPGLSQHFALRDGLVDLQSIGRTHPGVHHEKTCVIDGEIAFVGGMDINAMRDDDPDHEAERPWHDVTLQLRLREAATVVSAHFDMRWREAAGETDVPLPSSPRTFCNDAPVRIVGTASRPSVNPFRMTPRCVESSFAEAFEETVFGARHTLFVATQYLRSPWAGRRLAAALRQNPDLELMLLLPLTPEDIVEAGKDVDGATRHGQWLQKQALQRIMKAGGDRVGLFTMLRDGPPPSGGSVAPEGVKQGSDLVYVHAKTLIADRARAIIGSPNLNDRSLFMDTERAAIWSCDDGVGAFADRLFRLIIGVNYDTAPGATELQRWRNAAIANRRSPRGERGGFIVPVSANELCALSQWNPFVNSRFV